MKKLLLLMLIMLSIFGIGCSCNDEPPVILPPAESSEEIYMTVKQGNLSYNISKEEMYLNLKNTIGLSTVIDWADKEIVQTKGKLGLYEVLFGSTEGFEELDNTPYWDLVTEEEILAEQNKDKYPLGKENYAAEELAEVEKEYENKFYPYGYRTEESIKDFYRFQIAKEKLAKDYQELYRNGEDYGQGDYQTYYKNNYFNTYNMIVLPFESQSTYTKTLKELNIKVEVNQAEGYSKWVKNDTGEDLTVEEIIAAYIAIYNNSGLFKDSVSKNSEINEGDEYTIVDGKYQFNLKNEGLLYYPSEKVKLLEEDLLSYINNSMKPYSVESTIDSPVWYYASGIEIDKVHYTVLLLSTEAKKSYEDAKAEIKEELAKLELTEEFTNGVFSTLRSSFNLVIYDKSLQNQYINQYLMGSIPEFDMDNGDIVLAFDEKTLTKNQFFDIMDKSFGPYIASELVNYYNTLYDKNINKVYDLTIEGDEEDRIIDKKYWSFVLETVAMEKADFESGLYTQYGYPSGYGWENFLKEIYNVKNERELAYHYLRENILYDYLTGLYSLANYEENSLYWKKFQSMMQTLADEYFNATGFHFVLTIFDENNVYASPSTWTKEQTELIKEFYGLIVEYLDKNSGNYEEAVKLLEFSFNDAPYLVGENKTGELFDGSIDLSKYKTAGIRLYYEDLGTFTFIDLNQGLTKAAKELWDLNPTSDTPQVYGRTSDGYKYITSENGYHIYFNIRNNDMNRHEDRNVPTLEEIKLWIANPETEELTDKQKYMITNYYETIYVDLIGIYNAARLFYVEQSNYELIFETDNYTSDEYQKVLAITLRETEEQVNYLMK